MCLCVWDHDDVCWWFVRRQSVVVLWQIDRQPDGRTFRLSYTINTATLLNSEKNVFQLLLLLRGSSIFVFVWVMFTCPVFLVYVFVLLFYCSYLLWYWNMWFLLLICRHEIVWKFAVSSPWILYVCVVIWCFDRINIPVYDCVCESSLFALPPTGLYDKYGLCFVCMS